MVKNSNYQMQRQTAAGLSIGQVSDEPLTWEDPTTVTAGAASGVLVAANPGVGATVWIKVPVSATTGVCINFGAAATTSDQLIEPGEAVFLPTEQEIRVIRAGSSDVTVHVTRGEI